MTKFGGQVAVLVVAVSFVYAPIANAAVGWIAVANSPGHEMSDWGGAPNQAAAEGIALSNCARKEHASDCRIVEPINHIHGASGGGREVVLQAAIARAGAHANDAQVRCTWD